MSDSPIILNRRNILALSAIAGGISISAPLRAQINIGVRSTLVTMGVTVASLALGTQVLRRFEREEALELAFQQALSSRRE